MDTFRRKGRFPGLNGKLTGVLYVDGVKKKKVGETFTNIRSNKLPFGAIYKLQHQVCNITFMDIRYKFFFLSFFESYLITVTLSKKIDQ